MTNKIYAGVFEKISQRERKVGFGEETKENLLGTNDEIRQKIIDKKYYTQEELSRISTILGYDELSRDTKKNILLYSKLSEFAKKKARYKRQFGVDLVADDEYIEAICSKDQRGL